MAQKEPKTIKTATEILLKFLVKKYCLFKKRDNFFDIWIFIWF